jgi:hypothetical protein
VAFANAGGIFDWQSVYGVVDNTMNVAFFYVLNESDEPECVSIGFGSDDAGGVRVNGYPVFSHTGCRGHPGFVDKARAWLDPGKNLVSFYTFESGGGFNACIRFEDETGASVPLETTLDSTGYDPADHAAPPPGCGGDAGEGLSDLGLVTRFLVPTRALIQSRGAAPPLDAQPLDYISLVANGDPVAPNIDNVFEGALVGAGTTGVITQQVHPGRAGEDDELTRLAVFEGGGADPGFFNGELYYGSLDNYSSTGFFVLENRTGGPLSAHLAFASDDGAHLYVGGELILQHLTGRGAGRANLIQTGPAEVDLAPGRNLCQLSYVDGGGGSGFRVRVTKNCQGDELFSSAELVATVDVPNRRGHATRTMDLRREGDRVVATITIDVDDAPGEVQITEIPGRVWTVTEILNDGAIVDGQLAWNTLERSISYRLEAPSSCSDRPSRIDGTVDLTDGRRVTTRGPTKVALCDAPAFVPKVLLTPAFEAVGCGPLVESIEGLWLEDGTGLETERAIIPEDGLAFAPDFGGESQAIGLNRLMSANAQDRFTSGEDAVLAPVASNANGVFFFQNANIYGADVNNTMNVAFFYVVNEEPTPQRMRMGVGSDDSVGVRLNGFQVFSHTVCRGHGAFPDKFSVLLDPGKNLISVYTFEGEGGFGMCIRFENAEGLSISVPTTIDPEGYDPESHSPAPEIGISPLGFITRYLVPAHPLDQVVGVAPLVDAFPEDYISVEGDAPNMDNVRAGAEVTEGES